MKRALTLILAAVSLSTLRGDELDPLSKKRLAIVAATSAESLKKTLGDEWNISVDERTVTIESKFDIYRILAISRSDPLPPRDATADVLERETRPEKHIFSLRFDSPLSPKEFAKRTSERKGYAEILAQGTPKSGLPEIERAFYKIRIPQYRMDQYDVYRDATDTNGWAVYPISATSKISAAKELIAKAFSRVQPKDKKVGEPQR